MCGTTMLGVMFFETGDVLPGARSQLFVPPSEKNTSNRAT
jgi:hypothetical protein